LDAFNGAFKTTEEVESEEVFKSVGIDKEGGLVFTLDTLQASQITKTPLNSMDASLQDLHNKFLIKVHKAGDIPVMQEDKSSWTKIDVSTSNMLTKYITIKGEDVFASKPYKDLKIESRNCLFPDEGNSALFAHYTMSNCLLECSWKFAEAKCGCRPWHVPSEDGAKMCFVVGNICFKQVMDQIRSKKVLPECECKKDCVGSRYTLTLQNMESHERLKSGFMRHPLFHERTSSLVTMEEKTGAEVRPSGWYNLGEYVADRNFSILPHDPFLDMTFPRPLPLVGGCGWPGDRAKDSNKKCNPVEYKFTDRDSDNMLADRLKNFFKVAVYFEPDQSVITKITKDAKMTWSDKISWIGGNMGLFTGFSVISSIELLYWIWFKVIFHKKDENPSKETKEELGWRERRSQPSEDVEITDVNDNEDKIVDAEAATPAMDATCDTCAGSKASVERLEALVQELDDLKKAFSAATGQAGNVFDVVFAPTNAE